MSEWINKGAVGVLVFSALIGLGTTVHYRSKLNIGEYLNGIGLPLLSKESKEWSKVLSKYKSSQNLKISELEKEDENNLRDWCLDKGKKYFNNENKEIFKRISAWCTHPYSFKEWINQNKKRTIIKEPSKKDCGTKAEAYFLYEEDPIYLQFIKDCIIK